MDSVKIDVKQLLNHLIENRAKHVVDFDEAMSGYRKAMIDALTAKLKAAKKEEDVDHSIQVTRPISYLAHYDEAISMLEWTTQSEVELDRMQFKQYVRDEWAWKQQFIATSAMYKST
jgi:hypothetical protein